MTAAVITLSGISLAAVCVAGAFYSLYLNMRKQRNKLASELTAEKANSDSAIGLYRKYFEEYKAQLIAMKVDRQQNWVPKQDSLYLRQGKKFVKYVAETPIASSDV